MVAGADRAAQRSGFRRKHQFKPGGELEGSQNSQWILGKRRSGVPQDLLPEIIGPAVEIENPVLQRVVGDGVDGEVTPRSRFGLGQGGIGGDRKAAVASAGLGFTARQAEIIFGALEPDLQHAEAAPDEVDRPERSQRPAHRLVVEAIDLEVKILGLKAEEPVAHAAADQARPPAGGAQGGKSGEQGRRQLHALGKRKAWHASNTQPSRRLIPPSGVTGPRNFGPPRASQ